MCVGGYVCVCMREREREREREKERERDQCGEPAGGTPPVAKVMRKKARHMQRRDQASGVPLEILEHLPP